MRAEFIESLGRVTGIKSGILREAYCRITGDKAAARTLEESEVDERVADMIDMEVRFTINSFQLLCFFYHTP